LVQNIQFNLLQTVLSLAFVFNATKEMEANVVSLQQSAGNKMPQDTN